MIFDKEFWQYKTILLIIFITWLCLLSYVYYRVHNYYESNGGVTQIIINVGKDVKDIIEQINED